MARQEVPGRFPEQAWRNLRAVIAQACWSYHDLAERLNYFGQAYTELTLGTKLNRKKFDAGF